MIASLYRLKPFHYLNEQHIYSLLSSPGLTVIEPILTFDLPVLVNGEKVLAVTNNRTPAIARDDNDYVRSIFERLRKLNAEVVKLYDCHSRLPESLKLQSI